MFFLKENFKFILNKEDVFFFRFLIVLRGLVLDRIFNDLKWIFEGFVGRVKEIVEVYLRNIINLLFWYVFEVVYGLSLLKMKNSFLLNKFFLELFVFLIFVVSKVLRKVLLEIMIEGLFYVMEWKFLNVNDFNMVDT